VKSAPSIAFPEIGYRPPKLGEGKGRFIREGEQEEAAVGEQLDNKKRRTEHLAGGERGNWNRRSDLRCKTTESPKFIELESGARRERGKVGARESGVTGEENQIGTKGTHILVQGGMKKRSFRFPVTRVATGKGVVKGGATALVTRNEEAADRGLLKLCGAGDRRKEGEEKIVLPVTAVLEGEEEQGKAR